MANAIPFNTEPSDFDMHAYEASNPSIEDVDMDASPSISRPVLHLHYACQHPYRASRHEDIQIRVEDTVPTDELSTIIIYVIKPRFCQPCLQQRISTLVNSMKKLMAKVREEGKLEEVVRRELAYLDGVVAGRINAMLSPLDESEVPSDRQINANFNNAMSGIGGMSLHNDSSAVGQLADMLNAQSIDNDKAWQVAMAKVESEMMDQGVVDGRKYQADLERAALAVVDFQQRAELLRQSLL